MKLRMTPFLLERTIAIAGRHLSCWSPFYDCFAGLEIRNLASYWAYYCKKNVWYIL